MQIETTKANQPLPNQTGEFPAIDMALFENVRICRDNDFQSLVTRAAENSGCEFMFEIPAAMIGKNGKMAAALQYISDEEPKYCFVIVDNKTGSIELIQENEVSDSLLDLVSSYANVLNHLTEFEPTKELIH